MNRAAIISKLDTMTALVHCRLVVRRNQRPSRPT